MYFYPRPLRGGRQYRLLSGTLTFKFLSTPSARRATQFLIFSLDKIFISIHALCEEGDETALKRFACEVISIHALCEEGDDANVDQLTRENEFLSTPSARRATQGGQPDCQAHAISIHALCEEGDRNPTTT